MAMNNMIPPPTAMNCDNGDLENNWQFFKESFEDYRKATELDQKDESIQIATLKSVMGKQCKHILKQLRLADADMAKLDTIFTKLEEHFSPVRNVLYDRYLFHEAKQEERETIEQYVIRLRQLAEKCKYGQVENEMIRDRLVLGAKDIAARTRLFRDKECDLKKAIETLRISETTTQQIKKISGEQEVHALKQRSKYKGQRLSKKWESKADVNVQQCKYCGRKHQRGRNSCPAYGETCNVCSKRNHFASQCMQKKKNVNAVHDWESDSDSSDYEDLHLVEIHTLGQEPCKLFATMTVGKKREPVRFQLDSGATCNVINQQNLPVESAITKTTKILTMYNNTNLKPVGQSKVKMINPKNGNKYKADFVVVNEKVSGPLLGCKAIQQMNLLSVITENVMEVTEKSVEDKNVSALNINELLTEFPDVFTGLGKLEGQYEIEVDPQAKAVVHAPRKVPVAVKDKLKHELDRLECEGIITKVTKATPWVNSVVVIDKPNKTRVCLDPRDLNAAINRRHYPMTTIDEILPDLFQAKVFSVLDAKDGFWHVELTEKSSYLTTFNTPYGRYRYKRMPFGIASAPEEYQRRQDEALENLSGVKSVADDILVYGKGDTVVDAIRDHNNNLRAVMKRCQEKGLKLNKQKAKLGLREVRFIGHVISDQGLKPDKDKIQAVLKMEKPKDVTAVRRLIGFVNYLSKFMPQLSDMCQPLRELTTKGVAYHWSETHDKAFEKIKKAATEHPILRYYDKEKPLLLQADASETGLGAAIMQDGQPIAYASKALTDTETRYAQIEKELLASVWGLERFHQYTYGRKVVIQSDHKPLEMITRKPLYKAPKRLQTLLMRLQKYDTDINYHPGKHMYLADTLSRAYIPMEVSADKASENVNALQSFRVSEPRLDEIRTYTKKDANLQVLKEVIIRGWPQQKRNVEPAAAPYFECRDELSVHDDIICRGEKVIVPTALRKDILNRIHSSHLGVDGCIRRARECVYWPHMSTEVRDYIQTCDVCRTYERKQPKETLYSHEIPNRPWAKIGSDMFTIDNRDYLITVDYHSGFWEIDYLDNTTADTVIKKMKAQFSRYGIPDLVVSDSGAQYTGSEFSKFSKKWGFNHNTSSPYHQQANGKAEAAVKIAKNLLRKAKSAKTDPYLAILDYRNTPTPGMDTSPAQRMMMRRTKTRLPTTTNLLKPRMNMKVMEQLKDKQHQQAKYYNKGAHDLPKLQKGEVVRIQPYPHKRAWQKAVVNKDVATRSYEVTTETGTTLRRNRKHLKRTNERFTPQTPGYMVADDQQQSPTSDNDTPTQTPIDKRTKVTTPTVENQIITTRSGREIKRPAYLKDFVEK